VNPEAYGNTSEFSPIKFRSPYLQTSGSPDLRISGKRYEEFVDEESTVCGSEFYFEFCQWSGGGSQMGFVGTIDIVRAAQSLFLRACPIIKK
jgi:hypothetical protein